MVNSLHLQDLLGPEEDQVDQLFLQEAIMELPSKNAAL